MMTHFHRAGRAFAISAILALAAPATLASAALPEGAQAPDFTLKGGLAGKEQSFNLKKLLRKGPVVLYFFPAAFTKGCTVEAHAFAEAADSFRKQHATIIGVTAGNVERVTEFSKVECRDKFAVAADPGAVVAGQYQSTMQFGEKTWSDRTSYVIAPSGKILLSFTDRNPETHIAKTMEAVAAYNAKKG